MEENKILLVLLGNTWHAKHIGPHAAAVIDLFGTDTIPTPFTAAVQPGIVQSEIAERYPDCIVTIETPRFPTTSFQSYE